jgi:hypothetical protein
MFLLQTGDISSDEGSDSESDAGMFELDALGKLVARRWLSKTRRRLGLPDRKQAVLDISSDDDSTDSDDEPGTRPKLSRASEEIAKQWLGKVRGNLRREAAQANRDDEPARADISSDDDSSSGPDDRPVIAMSAQTRNVARKWLEQVRGAGPQRGRPAPEDVSDDDSSSSDDYGPSSIEVGPKARAIAKLWLQAARRTTAGDARVTRVY